MNRTQSLAVGVSVITVSLYVFADNDLSSQTAAVFQTFNEDATVLSCAVVHDVPNATYSAEYIDLADGSEQLLLTLKDEQYCGTAGCQFRLCKTENELVEVIPFGYAGTELTLEQTYSNTMRDLRLTTSDSAILLRWDGYQYLPEQSF